MNRVILSITALAMLPWLSPGLAEGQDKPKDVQWTHAFDLACRKLGEAEFTASTQKFGVEALRDLNTKLGIYLTEKGGVALAPGFADLSPPITVKGPLW